MADKKATPKGTTPAPENPRLARLKELEKMFSDKVAALDKMDAEAAEKQRFNLTDVKRRAAENLAAVKKQIADLSK